MEDLILYPIDWNLDKFSDGTDIIKVIGLTPNKLTVNLSIKVNKYHILKFTKDIDESIINRLLQDYPGSSIQLYDSDKSVLIMFSNIIINDVKGIFKVLNKNKNELINFFLITSIKPYSWFNVTNYVEMIKHSKANYDLAVEFYHYCTPIVIDNSLTDEIKKLITRAFWDHEVYAQNLPLESITRPFPQADRENDDIFMTSIVVTQGANQKIYLLTTKESNPISSEGEIILLPDERNLINTLWIITRDFQVMRSYSYNGFGFDLNYTAERMLKLGLNYPDLGYELQPAAQNLVVYKGAFGPTTTTMPKALGFSNIDLLLYFKKYYPWLENNKLETIGQMFLGEGKTGLPIEKLFQAYESSDKAELALGAEYAIQDSVLLSKLVKDLAIDAKLEYLANLAGIKLEEVLLLSDKDLIKNIIYLINPILSVNTMKVEGSLNWLEAAKEKTKKKVGIYRNIYTYDLTPFYRTAMKNSDNPLANVLADLLGEGWPGLIIEAYISADVYSLAVKNNFNVLIGNLLAQLIENDMLVAASATYIKTTVKLEIPELKVDNYYIALEGDSYMIVKERGGEGGGEKGGEKGGEDIKCYGQSGICKPTFPLLRRYIKLYIEALLKGERVPQVPTKGELKDEVWSDFIMTMALKKPFVYSDNIKVALYRQISEKLGYDLNVDVKVKWLRTITGPKILELFNEEADIIDYDYYRIKIRDTISALANLI